MKKQPRKPRSEDRLARQAILERSLSELETRRESSPSTVPTKWTRFLAQFGLTDSSGDLKVQAIKRGIIEQRPGGVVFTAHAKPVRVERGEEVVNAAKAAAEKSQTKRKIKSERMPPRARACLFWGMLADRHGGVKVGEEIDTASSEVISFTGYKNDDSAASFFSIIARTPMAEWVKGRPGVIKLRQDPNQMSEDDFQHPTRVRPLPGAASDSAPPAPLDQQSAELQQQLERVKREKSEATQRAAQLAEEQKRIEASLKERQRAEAQYAKEAIRARKAYDALSAGGKRAFIQGILQDEASANLVGEVQQALGATDQASTKSGPPPKKK